METSVTSLLSVNRLLFALQSSKWYAEEPRQTAVVGVELVANLVVLGLATVSLLVLPSLK